MRFELRRVDDDGARWSFVRDGAEVSSHTGERGRTAYEVALKALVAAATPVRSLLAAGMMPDTFPVPDDGSEDGLLPEAWVGAPAIAYNLPTGDGRDLTDCVFTWRDPAAGIVPLMLQVENQGGHFGSVLAGFFSDVFTVPGGVSAKGRFYDTDEGRKAKTLLDGGRKFGVSVDGGMTDIEWRCTMEDEEGWCVDETALVHALEVIGATMTGFPAFAEAAIALEGAPAEPIVVPDATDATATVPAVAASAEATYVAPLTAGAGPLHPPRDWMLYPEPELGDPELVEVLVGEYGESTSWGVPLTITAAGHVYGHLAIDGVCHIGYPGVCITAPPSPTNYAHFNQFGTVCDDGSRIGTGPLVVGCDHAAARLLAPQARDHYANNGLAWADVRASAGKFGIWIAGTVRPGISDNALALIERSGVSGDWRDIGGALELISGLTVPVPGFPMVRAQSLAAAAGITTYVAPMPSAYVNTDGVQVSLTAAGRVRPCAPCGAKPGLRHRPGPGEPSMREVFAEVVATRRIVERSERRELEIARRVALARIRG